MRKGPVHHYNATHYFLSLACSDHPARDQGNFRFSTEWPHVTCERCLEHRPMSDREKAERDKLLALADGTPTR